MLDAALTLLLVTATPSCAPPAPGMRCVPAAKLTVGDATTRRAVSVEAFFVDSAPVTTADLDECIAARACEGTVPPKRAPAELTAPAHVVWTQAEALCAFLGKRLPSEAEWEAALAVVDAAAAGPEWTHTWQTQPGTCTEANARIEEASLMENIPPAVCGTHDVLDPCDGAFFCGTLTKKVMKTRAAKGPHPRALSGWGGKRTAAVRCVTHTPWLSRFPSTSTTVKRAPPADPKAPSAEELAAFAGFSEDKLDTPLCDEVGRSFVNCRDPRSYLKTNEPLQHVVAPYLEGLGGGYTGVGSDQNYTFVALARSQWAWLFDYDPNVVNWHRVVRSLVIASETRQAFVERFAPSNVDASARLVKDAAQKAGEKDARGLELLFKASAKKLLPHYQAESTDKARAFTWLGTDDSYAYVRLMFAQGRMRAFKGNMLDVNTMKGIGAAANKLGVPIRVYYPSNAPEFWIFEAAYRDNVRALPFDDASIVVQTISSMPSGFGQTGKWHYNVQHGKEQQRLLALGGYTRLRQLMFHRVKTDSAELTISGLPSAPPSTTP